MDRWQFIESPSGAWYWLCSDVITHRTKTSASTFDTRNACVADACSSGYQMNTPGGSAAPFKRATGRRRQSNRRERYA